MIKLTLKDLKLFFADRRAMMLTLAVPISLITLFAFAFGGAGIDKKLSRTTITIVADEDNTAASKEVIRELDSLKEFEVRTTSLDTAENLVKKGDEAAVLVFHKGFSDSLNAGKKPPIEFKYDAAKEAEVGMLRGALTGSLVRIVGGRAIEKNALARFDAEYPNMDPVAKKKIRDQIMSNLTPTEIKKQSESFIKTTALVAEEENSPGLVQAVAGTAIMMLLFSVVGIGTSLLDEKQEGTLKKLLYSPLSPNSILFGKMLYANVIAIFQLTVMFLFAKIAFGLDIFPHLLQLVIMILCTAYACSSFGVVFASFAKSRQQVQGMSTLIVLTMSGIGGSMVPIFIMPMFMQKMAVFSVNYWGIQGFFDIFWRHLPVTDPLFLSRILVLLAIGTVLNIIAVKMFRKNVLTLS